MDSKGKDKRRRIDKESDEARNKKVRQGDPDDATEEEVEEFFAILRSIQVAVKYFEKGNGEGWRAAVEAEVVAAVGAGEDEKDEMEKKKEDNTANEAGPSARVSIMEESWEDSETTLCIDGEGQLAICALGIGGFA
ncbi:hypothetical protein GH714_018109 [Hevea brasiliensis]|uniref:Uncharacterized protein n=1 Tax=Hevea brasiliensis TaxID=3981 RepID=A0A6A6NI72_HEVBR|nr:hypothetical protein GH714_018109 [Hevea brasiliensis]